MRDILVVLLVFGSLPFILKRPYIGVLVWSWLSYMNPHRLSWGFAYDFPFAQVVAITLLISLLFSRDKKMIPMNSTTFTWGLFMAWMLITTLTAIFPDSAMTYFVRILKIQLITIITMMVMTDLKRIDQLIWVIVASIGFYSVKGGVFTFLTGGGFRVWGPPDSFIEENNGLALATLMTIPLMLYLWKTAEKKYVRHMLAFAIGASAISVLGSQSRGAFVSIFAVAVFLWLKSDKKLLFGMVGTVFLVFALSLMPQSFYDRMNTIQTYQEDASAMGRINAWQYSINVANDRITGAGFNSWSYSTFARYAPNPEDVHAAHSIFFGVLGDHGWLGLLLFLLILFMSWRNLSYVIRFKNKPGDLNQKYSTLATMMQVSFVAYCSGGAFLSLSYFDLPWHLIAITVLLKFQVSELNTRKARGPTSAVLE